MSPASRHAATIELCLERVAEHGDPTPRVYERLFQRHPEMKDLFVRDTHDSVKGEMLARAFEALMDFVGERRYANHMIGTEMRTHEGYDVPREIFSTFFAVVAEVIREILADEWTPDFAEAWDEVLAEIDSFAQKVPVVPG